MTANREIIAAVIATVATVVYAASSFLQDDPEVFLFPRILAVVMIILTACIWAAARPENSPRGTHDPIQWPALIPGVVIAAGYFVVLEWLGFYSSSFVAFFLLTLVYDKQGNLDRKSLLRKLAVTTGFLAALYLLFWHGLHVRTPTGVLL